MPKAKRFDLPSHPSFIGEPFSGRRADGFACTMIKVMCPRCGQIRERSASEMRSELRRPNFHGYCRPCSFLAVRSGDHRWHTGRSRPKLNNNGYKLISAQAIPDHLLAQYRAMQPPSRAGVLEHRWIMACHLGRALSPDELVDHRNGIKTDNRLDNLRIYLRGKNQPGSSNGYGTYYHEWQMAEAEIRRLKLQLADERDIGG
jgi:hypothetical protein